ncbi:hypothetical protein RJP21_02210 [Paenibacillus sp. VCA1]|uniref:hypothetical protein n=1 Tax=Paenibacillus sp. VCA1 TaxID=3039148 RepID=UPI0028711E4C|nr:hypothetical protein [Paenibacillus sp. VCA1]MDR9852411.1 hypothetical protein [Paenibacillus sp. VCA1]
MMDKPHRSAVMAPEQDSRETFGSQREITDWAGVERELARSLEEHVKIGLTVDTPNGTRRLRGFVTVINTYLKEIKLREEDDWQWIRFEDIRAVHI